MPETLGAWMFFFTLKGATVFGDANVALAGFGFSVSMLWPNAVD